MTYLSNPLTLVWAFLTVITVLSWWLGRDIGSDYAVDALVTAGVLLISAIKAWLVIRHFMEVRHAPAWLRWTCEGWLCFAFLMIFALYRTSG